MGNEKNAHFLDRVWDFFASIKLAIAIFALIGASSIVGTIIEQNGSYQQNVEIIGKIVGHGAAPAVYGALMALGFVDMYHSWWFTAFLLFFVANLTVCSIDRFPGIWKLVRDPLKPLKEDQFKAFPIKSEFAFKGKPEQVRDAFAALKIPLADHAGEGGETQYFGQRGAYTRLGVFVTHLSIVVIMAGAMIGLFFGFSGYLNLPEGAAYPMAFGRVQLTEDEYAERDRLFGAYQNMDGDLDRTASALGVDAPRLRARMKRLGIEPLGFTVACEEFEVKFYGTSDMPKEYTSHLVVFDGGREVMRKWIEVNAPLKYKGYYFYQSSYGMTETPKTYIYKLRAASGSGQAAEYSLRQGESLAVPGTSITAKVIDFSPALAFDANGTPYTYAELMNNPAVKIEVSDGTSVYTKWFLRRYPQSWALEDGSSIEVLDVWGTQYTGLQVRKDPGVLTVYLGCLIMTLGLTAAFFMSHRRLWVRVRQEKGQLRVTVAASVNKGREGLQRRIDRISAMLREGGK